MKISVLGQPIGAPHTEVAGDGPYSLGNHADLATQAIARFPANPFAEGPNHIRTPTTRRLRQSIHEGHRQTESQTSYAFMFLKEEPMSTIETPTLQSFIRDIIETGENDPAKITDKAIANILTHSEARTILFHAVYQVAKEEYRLHVRGLRDGMLADNSPVVTDKPNELQPRLRSTVSKGSRTVKHSPSRDQWLGERTWFPDMDRYINNGEATAKNWESRARYMNGQLNEHIKSVRLEIGVGFAAARLIRAHHVKCLNEVPGFNRQMLEDTSDAA